MPPRGRDNLGTNEPFRDDPEEDLLGPEQTSREDALSFLAIDSSPATPSEEELRQLFQHQRPWLQRIPHIPPRLQKSWHVLVEWTKGPDPPRPWKITPLFEPIQMAPVRFLHRVAPKRVHKIWAYVGFVATWFLVFSLVLWKSSFAADVPDYGTPVNVGCGSRFWFKGNACGLNGDQCRPFSNGTLTFRCPASCIKHEVQENYPVGDQLVTYRPLVIGGPSASSSNISESYYRGDSFICGAAIHAGYIKNSEGGCGVVRLVGEKAEFPPTRRSGISSIAFDSYFPLSYSFIAEAASPCKDLRWTILGINAAFSALLSIFTTSPAVFFWTIFPALFFHTGLVSDPPSNSDYKQLISTALGRFLPSIFVGIVMYFTTVKKTLTNLTAQFEKTILWVGACWVGALNNYTFDKIPISRLTPHDLAQQAGAIPALIGIVLGIFACAITQAWAIRIEGKMPQYLGIYGIFIGILLLFVAIPGMNLRIHHYIIGILLMPGTFPQTRPSLLFQGLLLGLFINGIARWGYDSILQTPNELRRGAALGSKLPQILPPIINNNFDIAGLAPNITFEWLAPPKDYDYDGISILVNEVERYKNWDDSGVKSFTWVKHREDLPEYFRFAFLSGRKTEDYTKAGVWEIDGGWTGMQPGPS